MVINLKTAKALGLTIPQSLLLRAAAVALVVMSSALTAGSQPAGKPARIVVLCLFTCEGPGLVAFRETLRDLGYVEGRTLAFEFRDAAGGSSAAARGGTAYASAL